ncbi:MAG: hypothetical protein ACLQU2_02670 [Candidatus Binataceae bacterium]
MKISRILALIAFAALALAAACTTSSNGPPSAITSAGQNGNGQASPYDQPLMATGGDLVMLRIVSRGIAG